MVSKFKSNNHYTHSDCDMFMAVQFLRRHHKIISSQVVEFLALWFKKVKYLLLFYMVKFFYILNYLFLFNVNVIVFLNEDFKFLLMLNNFDKNMSLWVAGSYCVCSICIDYQGEVNYEGVV